MGKGSRVIALGFFDGVHIGHAVIIENTVRLARELGLSACALSFSAHPQKLKGDPPELLTSTKRRNEIIKSLGIDEVLELTFDDKMLGTSACGFVKGVLYEDMGCAGAVCGENFRFGRGALGDAGLLTKLCAELGIKTQVCRQFCKDGAVVSSTLIRSLVKEGDVKRANMLMSRPLTLEGWASGGRFAVERGMITLPAGRYRAAAGQGRVLITVDEEGIRLSEKTEGFLALEIIEKY